MGQEPSVTKTTTVSRLIQLAESAKVVRPKEVSPCREYLDVMRRLCLRNFGGDFDKWLEAKTSQERREVADQLEASQATIVDWEEIDEAMIGWALLLMGEVKEPDTGKVVPLH